MTRSGTSARVVAYRSRVTFRRRWRGYLGLALLTGLLGGVAMAALVLRSE